MCNINNNKIVIMLKLTEKNVKVQGDLFKSTQRYATYFGRAQRQNINGMKLPWQFRILHTSDETFTFILFNFICL